MDKRMSEQELIDAFDKALENNDIHPVYQPQINHSTGRMVGAEALMRWKDYNNGMQYPSDFIPVLENNDLIYRADLHLFEEVCKLQRECIDDQIPVVPVSVNMSRHDIYQKDYVDAIEGIRKKYDVPVKYLRVEITESSAIGGMELISGVLDKLHEYGYTVEMDDFGSGYSSLNVLKDLNVDIIKLDMRFLSGNIGGRGGTILGSIVQMTKWLETPVIAEGVETMAQADYMKSLGCNYIQGYLYFKPITKDQFIEKLKQLEHEPMTPPLSLISTMNADKFWDPSSLETLIFSNFVGGAAIFSYQMGKMDIMRVNPKYVKELGMNSTEKDILKTDPLTVFDEHNKKIYLDTIKKAIVSYDEETCETWRTFYSDCCGEDKVCIRTHMRVIGNAGNQYLFYAMINNITKEKRQFADLAESEKIFRTASEHANIYAWEYIIATKEMRPCFRCMRDLSLPPVVKNYPEPVIENGLFPPDYADMYRGWMKQLEEGVPYLEAVIPLTVGRVPFRVRYTLEYDENGKPLKAYGSATLVVQEDE
ncbi:MAG: EAL domain-containing protein [Lachnospiraceae bacterium]|nr:EAL domain-containing protein [Lachnospiraceae bacterium]